MLCEKATMIRAQTMAAVTVKRSHLCDGIADKSFQRSKEELQAELFTKKFGERRLAVEIAYYNFSIAMDRNIVKSGFLGGWCRKLVLLKAFMARKFKWSK